MKNGPKVFSLLSCIIICAPFFFGCGQSAPQTATSTLSWNTVNDFAYQLQNVNLTAMGSSEFDLVVIDFSPGGSTGFTPAQIAALKNSSGGQKLVLAYLDIGEAENYRFYWQSTWTTGNPSWIGPVSPNYSDSYRVKYWEQGWKDIIYGSSSSYLDQIIAAGFDGVVLDVVDVYRFWEPGGPSGLDFASASEEMVSFVESIESYARVTKGNPAFGVFPNNALGLSSYPSYVQGATGILKEELWYENNVVRPISDRDYDLNRLEVFKNAGKVVLTLDYVSTEAKVNDVYVKSSALGYIPYATDVELDQLTINPGHAPN